MNRILITGANGQLGTDLCCFLATNDMQILTKDKEALDITNKSNLDEVVEQEKPNWIVNCAAFTNLDSAEVNKRQALDVNFQGPKNLAEICEIHEIGLIHISTDALFSSNTPVYFGPKDRPNPINAYGYSKQLGEEAIKKALYKHWILRSSWIYGTSGSKFFNLILKSIKDSQSREVVIDQFGQPTPTGLIYLAILKVLRNEVPAGVHHVVPKEFVSRHEFALQIRQAYEIISGSKSFCQFIPSKSLVKNGVAPRPKYSLLQPSDIMSGLEGFNDPISKHIYDVVRLREETK